MANKPNNPSLWSKAKSLARQKFDVYPSAYANGWASKYYKSKGGTWRKGEKGMMMQNGGTSTDIPVKRMRSKTVAVSPSGCYKTIEKQKLTPRGESSSSTVRRTARGLLKGAPRATNIMPNPGEINNMPNPKEIESPYLKTSLKNGGMTPANKAAMKLAKNMKGKVIGSDRMLKHGGVHSKPKMQNGSIISDKTVNPGKDYTFKYSLSKEEYNKIPTSSERFRSDVGKGAYDVYSKTGKYQPMSTAKKIVTSGEGTGIGRFGRIKLASGETGETRRDIRKELRSTGSRSRLSEGFNGCFPGAKPGSCRPQNIKGGSVGGSGFKVGGYHSKLKQSYLNRYK